LEKLSNEKQVKREERDEFLRRLKEEWRLLWRERFDDRFRAEGVAVRDYPLLSTDRGFIVRGLIVFASRDAKAPSFSEIVNFWASQGYVYAPNPNVGGWGKFIRTFIIGRSYRRKRESAELLDENCKKRQLKKGGRGWLHIE
jgi:hypothetical protein